MTTAEMALRSSSRLEGLAGVGPAERLGEDGIEVLDEVEEALTEVALQGERGVFEPGGGD